MPVLHSTGYEKTSSEAARSFSSRWAAHIFSNGHYWFITNYEIRQPGRNCLDRLIKEVDEGRHGHYSDIDERHDRSSRQLRSPVRYTDITTDR